MPGRYMVKLQRATASTTLGVGALNNNGTTARRAELFDLIVGSEGTPGDAAFLWSVERGNTALAAGTAVTPKPLDINEPASSIGAVETVTTNPTLETPAVILIPLNQRSTFRWVASPGSELILPASTTASLVVRTTISAAVAVSVTMGYAHY